MSTLIIAQTSDKIKPDFSDRRINSPAKRRPHPQFKVGDIATDGSFSCRPIVSIQATDKGLLYYFEGIWWGCPESTVVGPDYTNQPLLPLEPPLATSKYKVGDVA